MFRNLSKLILTARQNDCSYPKVTNKTIQLRYQANIMILIQK
jgi:hypothetical protein